MSINFQIHAMAGNITKDVIIYNNNIAKFSLAVSTGYGDYKSTTFFNCVAFSKMHAEKSWELLSSLKKGTNLMVEGEFVTSSFNDKNGEKRNVLEFKVKNFQKFFSDKKVSTDGEQQSAEQETAKPEKEEKRSENVPQTKAPEDDDIPF